MTRVATIAKRFTFDAAHRLQRLPEDHPCHRLHGHTYEVELVLFGPIDEETGFIVDYADIAVAWNERVASKLDHFYLNDVPGLEVPSTENLAYWIVRKIADHPVLVRGGRGNLSTLLQRVRVKESASTWCEIDVHEPASPLQPWMFSDAAVRAMKAAAE